MERVRPGSELLEPAFVARLEGLRLLLKRRHRGGSRGDRLGRRRGASLEFADHRDYAAGEDLRHLDWNLLARLDRPYLKTFVEEEDLHVSLLLDASASMGFGTPPLLDRAKRVAAAMAYLALGNLDRVALAVFDASLRSIRPSVRGKGAIFSLLVELSACTSRGATEISGGLGAFARSGASRPGLAVLLSDFLDPGDALSGLRLLAARGWEILCLRFRHEALVAEEGDLLLVDGETGEELEVSVGAELLAQHDALERRHEEGLRRGVGALGGRFLSVSPEDSLETIVLESLRRTGGLGR